MAFRMSATGIERPLTPMWMIRTCVSSSPSSPGSLTISTEVCTNSMALSFATCSAKARMASSSSTR